jgi:hypothetical protein
MSKRMLATGLALVLIICCLTPADAQTGFIAACFDPAFSIESDPHPCQAGLHALWFAAVNWSTFITCVQFQVDYPPFMQIIVENNAGSIAFGTTSTGLAMSWALPQNGFFHVLISRVDDRNRADHVGPSKSAL